MLSVYGKQIAWLVPLALCLGLFVSPADAQFGGRGLNSSAGPPGPQADKPRYRPQRFAPAGPRIPVAEVLLKGNVSVSESKVRAKLQTREGRPYDPQAVQADVRHLIASGLCYDVKTYRSDSPRGVVITFELFAQPTIQYIRFEGNKVREKTLLKKADLDVGQPLNRYRVDEARRRLEEYYRGRGYTHVNITTKEGANQGDRGVVFLVEEGPRQRIFRTTFEGNTIASDARLRTKIDSKPGILWLFKGHVDMDVIDEDVDKLTSYYRSLGFFKTEVRKELEFDDDQEWLTLKFIIDEGPRYRIRSLSVDGNEVFDGQDLLARAELAEGEFFDLVEMNQAVGNLRDAYGAHGYVNANVKAQIQFFEEPGQLDLVFNVDEGKQYRVGEIKVDIQGEYPHTRHSVVLNRIDLREGDIIDIRKLRNSQRRLKSSQLFENTPMNGPEITVVPRDSASGIASRPGQHY